MLGTVIFVSAIAIAAPSLVSLVSTIAEDAKGSGQAIDSFIDKAFIITILNGVYVDLFLLKHFVLTYIVDVSRCCPPSKILL